MCENDYECIALCKPTVYAAGVIAISTVVFSEFVAVGRFYMNTRAHPTQAYVGLIPTSTRGRCEASDLHSGDIVSFSASWRIT